MKYFLCWTVSMLSVPGLVTGGITLHNVRRRYRAGVSVTKPPVNLPDNIDINPHNRLFDNVNERVDTEHENRDFEPFIPPHRRPFHERLWRGFSKLLPSVPSLPSFNIIKRYGGLRRRYPQFIATDPPTSTSRGRRLLSTTQGDRKYLPRPSNNNFDRQNFKHRLGYSTTPMTSRPETSFQNKITELRTGLLVDDPRMNFYNVRNYHEERREGRPGLESDLRNNMIHRAEKVRRRVHRRRRGEGHSVSDRAGPPYPGPHPRNPRLPLDKTIIYP